MTESQHGGKRPGAGRKWDGHVKYERVSFVAPPALKRAMDQIAKDLDLTISAAWRVAAHSWLETYGIDWKDDEKELEQKV